MKSARSVVLGVLLATACSHGARAQDPGTLAASAVPGAIMLGTGPTEVTLVATGGGSVAARLRGVGPGGQIYLEVGAQAQSVPATTYNVYLGLPANATPPGISDLHYVGTLNFFNAASGRTIAMSFNITARVGRLLQSTDIEDRVTIVPAGEPPGAAAPQIGDVRITAR